MVSTMPDDTFPLHQWFDMSKRIDKYDRELCEAQMSLWAYKDGLDPEGPEWRDAVKSLRTAVKAHNAKF